MKQIRVTGQNACNEFLFAILDAHARIRLVALQIINSRSSGWSGRFHLVRVPGFAKVTSRVKA